MTAYSSYQTISQSSADQSLKSVLVSFFFKTNNVMVQFDISIITFSNKHVQ